MFCPNCGTPVSPAHQACPSCGTPTPQNLKPEPTPPQQTYSYCRACGTPIPAGQPACSNCGTAVVQQPYTAQKPMNWFKFLIYFSLWAGGIINIISGFSTMFGLHYAEFAEATYRFFPGQRTVDILYGIVCILMGIYAIVTRFQLARFRKNAPAILYGMYALYIVFPCMYLFATAAVTLIPLMQLIDAEMIGQLIGTAVMIVVNVIYFGKRRDMFIY